MSRPKEGEPHIQNKNERRTSRNYDHNIPRGPTQTDVDPNDLEELIPVEKHSPLNRPYGRFKHYNVGKITKKWSPALPCPKCKGTEWLVRFHQTSMRKQYMYARCLTCGYRAPYLPADHDPSAHVKQA